MDQEMAQAKRLSRGEIKWLVTPCCRAIAALAGRPPPRYTCAKCGAVYVSLASFVTLEEDP